MYILAYSEEMTSWEGAQQSTQLYHQCILAECRASMKSFGLMQAVRISSLPLGCVACLYVEMVGASLGCFGALAMAGCRSMAACKHALH